MTINFTLVKKQCKATTTTKQAHTNRSHYLQEKFRNHAQLASICHRNLLCSTCVPVRMWHCHHIVFYKGTQRRVCREQRRIPESAEPSAALGAQRPGKGAEATCDPAIPFLTKCLSWTNRFPFFCPSVSIS